ncbi:hypothetical protein KUF54_09320 [Comamonas sp. Y33R10-2]|uniref:hypothetical protein n=1 Tax=Comamonas sp. Y33R10-2 TaxID=2853257 RepID=UPI001C5CBF16|nr:hypothetical protein [Comamonas sp. Y33R10-2]QXZ08316.1 hypothetical protein KUF54_09320 [Comamonas sp. Y33R10-2]
MINTGETPHSYPEDEEMDPVGEPYPNQKPLSPGIDQPLAPSQDPLNPKDPISEPLEK